MKGGAVMVTTMTKSKLLDEYMDLVENNSNLNKLQKEFLYQIKDNYLVNKMDYCDIVSLVESQEDNEIYHKIHMLLEIKGKSNLLNINNIIDIEERYDVPLEKILRAVNHLFIFDKNIKEYYNKGFKLVRNSMYMDELIYILENELYEEKKLDQLRSSLHKNTIKFNEWCSANLIFNINPTTYYEVNEKWGKYIRNKRLEIVKKFK